MKLNDIREAYLSFFEKKLHTRIASASLIPQNDKSLLIINSGMAPLKPYFIGKETPPNVRLASCQKCIRTGDIENVGKTQRHGTFFEMLGNFSFGEYFKKEATAWALEFCLDVLKLPKEALYFSIYEEDEETSKIWEELGVPKEHIVRLGKEDNFWEVGTGPCGPCSELYYDRGEKYGCGSESCAPGCECDRFLEFWNLVFTQFNKEEDGSYTELSSKNIDTGMGLERMAVIMQNVSSIFDVDTMQNIISEIEKLSGKKYGVSEETDVSIRIITDHIRSITFMLSDGILPSNEGRGYVLRRLLRRAVRHGKKIGIDGLFLEKLAATNMKNNEIAYPEMIEKKSMICKYINIEEEAFNKTVNQGFAMLDQLFLKGEISGEDAFKMYDTYGFPIELLVEVCEEKGINVDIKDYEKHMQAQKERARNARITSSFLEGDIFENIPATQFENDEKLLDAKILKVIEEKSKVKIILDKTPFFAESGGQVGDRGLIYTENAKAIVETTVKNGDKIVHISSILEGTLTEGEKAKAVVNGGNRADVTRNHTATHLLHYALRKVLGEEVSQAGSEVSDYKIRFDFNYFNALTAEQIMEIETIVKNLISEAIPVVIEEKSLDEAKKQGAIALFGEKYENIVRVVKVGPSMELCGGTHLTNTCEISEFKIISESSIASGIRRIEALTSLYTVSARGEKLELEAKMAGFKEEIREKNQKIEILENKLNEQKYLPSLIKSAIDINGNQAVLARIDDITQTSMLFLAEKVKESLQSSTIALIGASEKKVNIVVLVTEDLVKKGVNAGNIAREMAKITGGGGGGKPMKATAGGKDIEKIKDALELAKGML
ncbi:MAG: alanine--tRNA ligase [Defluviitaleaceae bacterium]|nr:alanine--tRNA ligase [Defluviitaleaceae bacterium]